MQSLGDVRKTEPLEVVSVKYRPEEFDWLVEYRRNGFVFFKTISTEVFVGEESFKRFLNELITEVRNG